MTTSWLGLIGWLLVVLAAGAAGALATRDARAFYAGLVKPRWAPPGWLFGPVWTALYLLMGIAAWLVSPTLALWMSPVVLGLLLSIPLGILTSSRLSAPSVSMRLVMTNLLLVTDMECINNSSE